MEEYELGDWVKLIRGYPFTQSIRTGDIGVIIVKENHRVVIKLLSGRVKGYTQSTTTPESIELVWKAPEPYLWT